MSTITTPTAGRPLRARRLTRPDRAALALLAFAAATLVVFSTLHLAGALHPGSDNSGSAGAGGAEAVICVALVAGAVAFARRPADRGRSAALAATLFAIFGFIVGLTFTVGGGDAIDLLYHAVMLPVFVLTAVMLARGRRRGRPG